MAFDMLESPTVPKKSLKHSSTEELLNLVPEMLIHKQALLQHKVYIYIRNRFGTNMISSAGRDEAFFH